MEEQTKANYLLQAYGNQGQINQAKAERPQPQDTFKDDRKTIRYFGNAVAPY